MDAKDLQKRWKGVVKTCGLELNTAAPSDKTKWIKARAAAQLVVDSLTPIVPIESAACKAWQEARLEKSDKPKPVFTLVSS
jgi:hypothetical protein